jgi:ketosteroid isomerase-like protein
VYGAATVSTAASNDLGIAFGAYRLDGGRERGTWARVWQRDLGGRWRIVFETSHPGRGGFP